MREKGRGRGKGGAVGGMSKHDTGGWDRMMVTITAQQDEEEAR